MSQPVTVQVTTVERGSRQAFYAVAGTVRPLNRATVSARIAGIVSGADFTVGQAVNAGQLLLTLQADELRLRRDQAQVAADQAVRDATRDAKLSSEGAATKDAVRAAEDRRLAALAALDEASTLLSYSRVVAPFAGVITRKPINTGDFTAPGTPLCDIEAPGHLRAELAVPESLAPLPVGAVVRMEKAELSVFGPVVEISPALDPVTRTRIAVVELPDHAAIRSGDFVRALWPAGAVSSLTVPRDAVQSIGQIERAFTVTNGKAMLRLVRTGRTEEGRVQILAGLNAGETVVVSPPTGLRDGQPVIIAP